MVDQYKNIGNDCYFVGYVFRQYEPNELSVFVKGLPLPEGCEDFDIVGIIETTTGTQLIYREDLE